MPLQESARDRCGACQAVTDAGKPTTCPECPERIRTQVAFEDTIGCDMCGAHIDDPCDCFDPQKERRTR